MNISDFTKHARRLLDTGYTIHLKSPPGTGKSDTIEYLTKKFSQEDGHEWGFNPVFLANYAPVDLMGYMVVGTQNPGTPEEVRVSEFTMPPWMITPSGKSLNDYQRGILLFDEYDKAEPDVKRGSGDIMLKHGLGRWQLHDGIGIISCANRAEDRSGSTKDYDFIINRRIEIDLHNGVESWLEWANANAINPLIKFYVEKHPDAVFGRTVPEKQGPFTTPRSIAGLSRVLDTFEKDGVLDLKTDNGAMIFGEIAQGMVGEATANDFMTWLEIKDLTPDIRDIVAAPKTTKIPPQMEAKMLTAYECAHRATPQTLEPILEFIYRMPPEFHTTFGVCLVKRDHSMLAQPAMREFLKRNQALLIMIGQ